MVAVPDETPVTTPLVPTLATPDEVLALMGDLPPLGDARAKMRRMLAPDDQAEVARQQRLNEQKHLADLKREAAQMAATKAPELPNP